MNSNNQIRIQRNLKFCEFQLCGTDLSGRIRHESDVGSREFEQKSKYFNKRNIPSDEFKILIMLEACCEHCRGHRFISAKCA